MVRNRWIGIVVAIALLAAIVAPPARAATARQDQQAAVVDARPASVGGWFGTWIEAAWGWFVAVLSEETGSIVPNPSSPPAP